MEWFVAPGLNHEALDQFFEKIGENGTEIHTMQIYRHGEKILRLALEPYSCSDAREIYSLSKTFDSSVVGIACDMGLLSVEDSVADILGKTNVSEYFAKMKVRHVLSMNTGHSRCVMPEMAFGENAVDGFFSVEPEYEPGTHFTYNTGASCLLTALVEKVTGRGFFDFASEYLFAPLGITDAFWTRCKDGTCVGGAGLHVSNDDIIKLGLMLQNGGVYQGKRILSEKWVQEASSAISDNSANETPDWQSGYGYQIWRNARDGFRGDGAFGQLCMVLPGYDMVLAIQANAVDFQREIDLIMELVENLDESRGEPRVRSYLPVSGESVLETVDACYHMEENPSGIRTIHLKTEGDSVCLSFGDGNGLQSIRAQVGSWTENSYYGKCLVPGLQLIPMDQSRPVRAAVSCAGDGDRIILYLRYKSNPHIDRFEIKAESNRLEIRLRCTSEGLRNESMCVLKGCR